MATYFPDLLAQYKDLLQQMKSEGITSGSMYTEVKQAIEWMETGYDPAERRAAIRIDAYSVDPYHMQTYMKYVNDDDDEMLMPEFLLPIKEKIEENFIDIDAEAPEWQNYVAFMMRDVNAMASKAAARKEKIAGAMQGLTADEKTVFVAIEAEGMSFGKVADMLGVTKSTVQSYHRRARMKIRKNIEDGTQEELFGDIA